MTVHHPLLTMDGTLPTSQRKDTQTLDCESRGLTRQLLVIGVAQTSFSSVLKGKQDWEAR